MLPSTTLPQSSDSSKSAWGLQDASQTTTYAVKYDVTRWKALVEFDPEIAKIEATLKPFGQKYVDQFAAGYLALNDRNYIPNIIEKILETARRDSEERKAQEELWANRYADPNYILRAAGERIVFLGASVYGNVVVLKDGRAFLDQNDQITSFADAVALREAVKDRSEWAHIEDADTKLKIIKKVILHAPDIVA